PPERYDQPARVVDLREARSPGLAQRSTSDQEFLPRCSVRICPISSLVVAWVTQAAPDLARRKRGRMHVRVGGGRADRLDHLGKAGRSPIDALSGTRDDIRRGERSRDGSPSGRACLGDGYAGGRGEIRAEEEHDLAGDGGSTEVDVRLRHVRGEITVRQLVVY